LHRCEDLNSGLSKFKVQAPRGFQVSSCIGTSIK